MKIKISMNNLYGRKFRAGYCDLQNIMYGIDPDFYNAGVYGWNCDIYETPAGYITTGYRNMRGDRIPNEIIRKYDKKARDIMDRYAWKDYDKKIKKLDALREKFYQELNNL